MEYGILSLLPPILAMGLAIKSRDVLLSVLAGVFSGIFILAEFNPARAFVLLLDEVSAVLGSENIVIVLIVIFLGGMVGLLVKSGGNRAFAAYMSKRIRTRVGAQLAAWAIGVCIFFDDYFNCLMIGPTMRPIIDEKKISREKLAYIIDSTSASMCTLTPVSSWVAYILGFVALSFGSLGIADSPLSVYIRSIPYNMYSIFALLLIPIVVCFGLDFGPMAKAEKRAQEAGGQEGVGTHDAMFGSEFDAMEVSEKGAVSDLVLPIVLLFVAAFFFIFLSGGLFDGASIVETFQEADSVAALYYAAALCIVATVVYYMAKGCVSFRESFEATMTGMKSLMPVVVFITCAWLLGSVCEEMGTAEYLVDLVGGAQVGFLVPFVVFFITCVITFSTGSGWGSIAIMTPIALPLAYTMGANMPATLAAVLSGVVFGDHASPICDTTVLSSAGAQCNHIDHCVTQIPYAVTAASAAAVGFLVAGFTASPVVPLFAGLSVFGLLVFFLHRLSAD